MTSVRSSTAGVGSTQTIRTNTTIAPITFDAITAGVARSAARAAIARPGASAGPSIKRRSGCGRSTPDTLSLAADLGLQEHLDRAVLLLLEDVVAVWRLVQRKMVGVEVVDAERVPVALEQGHDLGHPVLHVRLPHPQLDLLVEHREHRQRVGGAAIDA